MTRKAPCRPGDAADFRARREWTPTYGRSFSGSTVGVVGLGAIGRAVADRAHAMGAHNLFDLFADNLSRYLRREPLRNLVDLQAGY